MSAPSRHTPGPCAADPVALYTVMRRIRRIEEAIAARYDEQKMRCPVHLSIGQEAVPAGVCAVLRPHDAVMSGHRSHAPYLAKGGDLAGMIAEIHGKVTGVAGGKGGSMHLVDEAAGFLGSAPIVGSTIPIAAGVAFSARMQGQDRVSAVFFGDGATETGAFTETLNLAALHELPLLLVCENNLYSVYSPLEVRQPPQRSLKLIAEGHGVAYDHGDGNDAEAVQALAARAMAHIRGGSGPVLLEFDTYRWREHCGPNYDNDLGYRTVEEFETWKARCPLRRARRRLEEKGLWDDRREDDLLSAIDAEIEAAFAAAAAAAWPERQAMMRDVFASGGKGV